MLQRRDFLGRLLLAPWWAQPVYAEAIRGLPPLEIEDVKVIATSPTPHHSWIFVKVITSEPGLIQLQIEFLVAFPTILIGGEVGHYGGRYQAPVVFFAQNTLQDVP